MRWNLRMLLSKGGIIIGFFCCACDPRARGQANPYPTIESIPVPAGYRRVVAEKGSFGAWLRQIPLKKDKTVYLFDGSPKRNQDAQFAVLAVSVGNKDLQQCADAVMRLRAEYLYGQKEYAAIEYTTGQGLRLNFRDWASGRRVRLSGGRLVSYGTSGSSGSSGISHPSRTSGSSHLSGEAGSSAFCADRGCFSAYLETVFSYCGTLSLEKQLVPVEDFHAMRIGDVLIRGGAPGHAMLVVDMAVDSLGHTLYMLAQSYMPAQDIHIVNNPLEALPGQGGLSPWYRTGEAIIQTPEWTFYPRQLRTWPRRPGV